MIIAENIYRSTKRIGKYEEQIIGILIDYFKLKGYQVIPHSSLNIAYGSILSDVDLLLIKNGNLTYVEVKSSRDHLARARQQIERVTDYIDYAYVATDKRIKDWNLPNVGLIYAINGKVTIAKRSKKLVNPPKFYSIATLKKKCLARFCDLKGNYIKSINKYELAENVYSKGTCPKSILKEIVTCGDLCASNCPIRIKVNER